MNPNKNLGSPVLRVKKGLPCRQLGRRTSFLRRILGFCEQPRRLVQRALEHSPAKSKKQSQIWVKSPSTLKQLQEFCHTRRISNEKSVWFDNYICSNSASKSRLVTRTEFAPCIQLGNQWFATFWRQYNGKIIHDHHWRTMTFNITPWRQLKRQTWNKSRT